MPLRTIVIIAYTSPRIPMVHSQIEPMKIVCIVPAITIMINSHPIYLLPLTNFKPDLEVVHFTNPRLT